MKKITLRSLVILAAMMFFALSINAENISKKITVKTMSYSTSSSYAGTTQTCGLSIYNGSGCNIIISGILVYKMTDGEVFFIDTTSRNLNAGSSTSFTISYPSYNFLTMGGWIVQINYVNLSDNQSYIKLARKNPNSYGTNVGLEDISEGTSDVSYIKSSKEFKSDFFDLQGRKVANPEKGIYIVNGKKVMIK